MFNYSIIIPHKNSPELLRRCLSSIPYRNDVQIIVVDDNSDSRFINWDTFGLPSNIDLLCTHKSKGAGFARNVGLNQAKGKWVVFADCDDYFNPGFLDILDRYVDSDYDVVYYNYRIRKNDTIIIPKIYESLLCKAQSSYNPVDIDSIKYKRLFPWNKMVRRSFVEQNCIRFEECINGNDLFYTFQVGYFCNRIAFEISPLYNYVQLNSSLTHSRQNSDEYYLCIFSHRFKCNKFYEMIGHRDWTEKMFKKFLAILIKKGPIAFSQAIRVYISNIKSIRESENDFVLFFQSRSSSVL